MRQIKFRAWDKEGQFMLVNCIWPRKVFVLGEDIHRDSFELMQFTGLLDKNGKEIYEGDVVKHREIEVGNLEVQFYNGQWLGVAHDTSAQPLFDEEWWTRPKGNDKMTNIEIIGNIYENPELLKV